jgi:hypothetical protein
MTDKGEKTELRREQEAVLEYYKQAHDTQKSLATLSAGAIVLIGTFLRDIFPKTIGGGLSAGLPTKLLITKLLIAASILCFGVSLITSSYKIRDYTKRHIRTALMDEGSFKRFKQKYFVRAPKKRDSSDKGAAVLFWLFNLVGRIFFPEDRVISDKGSAVPFWFFNLLISAEASKL